MLEGVEDINMLGIFYQYFNIMLVMQQILMYSLLLAC